MRSLYISLRSEFYKSRKTLAFWAAIILPLFICGSITLGYLNNSEKLLALHYPGMALWGQFIGISLNIMGVMILPFYVLFMAFSINNIEHRNDTWKTLFTQPLNKFSIYTAKYLYGVLLIFICLFLFAFLTLAFGYLLQVLVPQFTFRDYNPGNLLVRFYFKLFLSSIGILSVQFILSLIWGDFLKPMGVGFIGIIMGLIAANVNWKFAYLIPYSDPTLALRMTKSVKSASPPEFPIWTQEVWTSLAYGFALFIIGYFIVSKKNIK